MKKISPNLYESSGITGSGSVCTKHFVDGARIGDWFFLRNCQSKYFYRFMQLCSVKNRINLHLFQKSFLCLLTAEAVQQGKLKTYVL